VGEGVECDELAHSEEEEDALDDGLRHPARCQRRQAPRQTWLSLNSGLQVES
jgi:hypothetical protein